MKWPFRKIESNGSQTACPFWKRCCQITEKWCKKTTMGSNPSNPLWQLPRRAVSRTDGKATREERPRNTVSSLTTTTQQKMWADACKEETSDSESTQLSEAHGSKIKKRKRKLMPSHSTSKDIQHNASNVKQVHSSTGDPNRSRTVGGVRLRQELEIRQLSKYNLPKWESEASDDEPLWKLVTNRKPGPPKVDIYLGNLPEEMTKEKVTKYIQRRAQSAGESPPTIFRCTVQNAKPQTMAQSKRTHV